MSLLVFRCVLNSNCKMFFVWPSGMLLGSSCEVKLHSVCRRKMNKRSSKMNKRSNKRRPCDVLCVAQFRARRTSTPILPTICLNKARNNPRVRTLISIQSHIHSLQRVLMPKQHTYVLGLNTYDHDVSACLLRDGVIAFAIAKERITREKHASGFYQEVIDYCLDAEGITLDDVDLIVRNCYILPVRKWKNGWSIRTCRVFSPSMSGPRLPSTRCICRVPTRWCRSRTISRMPTARSPSRRSRKAS